MNKILVIEDNLDVRENIEEILTLSNFKVYTAANGKIGVALAIEKLPDLILCDIMMPELDGYGVLKILSRSQKTFNIPFIFLTAKVEKDDIRKGMTLGADDYIMKPFDNSELLDVIDLRLKKNKMLKQNFATPGTTLQNFHTSSKKKIVELDIISKEQEHRFYLKKEFIYSVGQNTRWLFYIASGNVKIVIKNDFGKELISHVYKTGDFFGYFPLLKNSVYSDSAVAMNNCEIVLIPKNDFTNLIFTNRDFSAQFIKMIANETAQVEQQLIDLAYSSVRRKVANSLLTLAVQTDLPFENGITITSSRDDLAALACTAKETLIRTLSDFKTEDILSISGSKISILDLHALQDMPQ